jgi:hypothetical protein
MKALIILCRSGYTPLWTHNWKESFFIPPGQNEQEYLNGKPAKVWVRPHFTIESLLKLKTSEM